MPGDGPCSRPVGSCFGFSGTSSTGWGQVGAGVSPQSAGRPTAHSLYFEKLDNQSETEGICSVMPPAMGDSGTVIPSGNGCHQQSSIRSFLKFRSKDPASRRRWRSSTACTKEEAEVSEEAKSSGIDAAVFEEKRFRSATTSGDGIVPDGGCNHCSRPSPPADGHGSRGTTSILPDLGSGDSPCKAEQTCDYKDSSVRWTSLQSHGFDQWCSSLMRKALRSGTKFGAFLNSTSQVNRAGSPVSAKALFPLPVPSPGVFDPVDGRPSAKKRRKRCVEQAFHVMVMALNYLHADCQFVDLKLLARPPNDVQVKALENLKKIFLAFGHSAGEISVPASGRRCTSLVSLLADLGEFLTREGTTDSAYHRGFPGQDDSGILPSDDGPGGAAPSGNEKSPYVGQVIAHDIEKAPELVPYRDLEPSRLKLHGRAQWNPEDYLDDPLWMAFVEPFSLRWTSNFDVYDLPDLQREDPTKVLELAKVWDVNGLLRLAPPVIEDEMVPSCLRVFNCYKSATTDRQIGDRRGMNQLEGYLPGPSRSLPCGYHLSVLEADPKKETIVACISDRRDFYHQIQVSASRSHSNKLWPPLPLKDLQGTQAHAQYINARPLKRQKEKRLETGDQFKNYTSKDKVLADFDTSEELVFGCFNSVVQGDHLGVEIATQGHRGLLVDEGLLDQKEELQSCAPFLGDRSLQGLVIDDFFSVSVEEVEKFKSRAKSMARLRFDRAQAIYEKANLLGSRDKDVVDSTSSKIAGAELVSDDYVRSLGLITLAPPAAKRLALSFLSLELCRLDWSTDALHACLIGGWTSCLMFRRPLMCIFDQVYHCCDMAFVQQASPKLFKMKRKVKEELTLMAVLAPLVCADLTAVTLPKVFATDASDKKGAFVSAEIPKSFSKVLWRLGKKKGGYVRMLSREKALLSKIDHVFEEEGLAIHDISSNVHPEKPRAFRYHFMEICGGAGKVAKEMASKGLSVGPVVDLDRSPFFDLQMLRVLSWLLYMVQNGLLDAFLIAPPCTTFSPAQHPSSRSYAQPRGFNPTEEKTLNGTTLALRSLTVMMVASFNETIGLLEQSRRSKMAWLREWRALIELYGARETHLASCNFGSIHQKEFRLLGVNFNVEDLYAPCTRDHVHVKVQGSFTKATAVYTDLLAKRFADVFEEAIRKKRSRKMVLEPKTEGLESLVSNACALSADWKEEKSWRWKKSPHINILEASAYARLIYFAASEFPRTRFAVGLDSNVAMSAIIKGRTPSYSMRPVLRRIGASTVAGCLYPSLHFFPTRLNPSDHPTRDTCIPDPSPNVIDFNANPEALLSLHQISGLRRFASNWVRLVFLLIGASRPWTDPSESWRFTTWSVTGYPYAWTSSARRPQLGFDKTLGFPGEGPSIRSSLLSIHRSFAVPASLLALGLIPFRALIYLLELCLQFVSPSQCNGWILLVFCLLVVVFVCWNPTPHQTKGCGRLGFRCLILVLPWRTGAVSAGASLARTPGDAKRAEHRKEIKLDEGRPVLGKTKEARAKLTEDFDGWLQTRGTTLSELIDPRSLDIDAVNSALESFGRDLHRSGRPYNHYAETINAISALRPSLRRVLQGAWDLAFTWLREEPPTHHVALPWQALLCLITTAFIWNWPRVAGVIALSWGGITRIGEVFGARRKHLVLPGDLGRTIQYCLLQIQEPKTRFKAARHQVAKLDQPQLLKVVEVAFETLAPEQALWPLSPQTLRKRFQSLVESVGLHNLPVGCKRGLDLGSLRAGGASWMLMTTEDSELVRRRGRWINNKIMEIYIQEAASLQFLPQLPPEVRSSVLQGAALFPTVLKRIRWWYQCGLPEAAWRTMLLEEDTHVHDGWK